MFYSLFNTLCTVILEKNNFLCLLFISRKSPYFEFQNLNQLLQLFLNDDFDVIFLDFKKHFTKGGCICHRNLFQDPLFN